MSVSIGMRIFELYFVITDCLQVRVDLGEGRRGVGYHLVTLLRGTARLAAWQVPHDVSETPGATSRIALRNRDCGPNSLRYVIGAFMSEVAPRPETTFGWVGQPSSSLLSPRRRWNGCRRRGEVPTSCFQESNLPRIKGRPAARRRAGVDVEDIIFELRDLQITHPRVIRLLDVHFVAKASACDALRRRSPRFACEICIGDSTGFFDSSSNSPSSFLKKSAPDAETSAVAVSSSCSGRSGLLGSGSSASES